MMSILFTLLFGLAYLVQSTYSGDFLCDLMAASNIMTKSLANWNTGFCNNDAFICANNWAGISCSGSVLNSIVISSKNIAGTIPSSIGSTTLLTKLYIDSNSFYGTIPNSITNLVLMRFMKLSVNSFNGPIPNFAFPQLELLYLQSNCLTGAIPAVLGTNTLLTGLYLFGNSLTGSVPTSFGSLTKMADLRIYGSFLESYPSSLCSITALTSGIFYFSQSTTNECFLPTPSPTLAPTLTYDAKENAFLCDFIAATNVNTKGLTGWSCAGVASKCTWTGIYCPTSRIVSIDLTNKGVSGTIPNSIGSLSDLTQLQFFGNPFFGTFPSSLGKLGKLRFFQMHGFSITGSLPTAIGGMTSLTLLGLSSSSINGTLPSQLSLLTNLQILWMSGNSFSGLFPSSIGSLSLLTVLDFGYSKFTGQLPSTIGSLTNLASLNFYSNSLGGTIPATFGNLVKLRDIHFTNNHLMRGPLPSTFGSLVELTFIEMPNCGLNGTLPTNFGNLVKLSIVYLNDNSFTGTLPSSIGLLSKLDAMLMSTNRLTGTIPSTFAGLSNIRTLLLHSNSLLPVYPTEMCTTMVKLTNFQLMSTSQQCTFPTPVPTPAPTVPYGNLENTFLCDFIAATNISAAVPEFICVDVASKCTWYGVVCGQSGHITEISVTNFLLSGNIPNSIGSLTELNQVMLNGNLLSSTIPSELGNLKKLNTLMLQYNRLHGTIPESLYSLTNLQNLILHVNLLTGTLSESISSLHSLTKLYMYSNSLHGTLPEGLSMLNQLQSFSADVNHFTGTLPPSMSNMSALVNLLLSGNNMTGTVPSTFAKLTNLTQFNLFGNRITPLYPYALCSHVSVFYITQIAVNECTLPTPMPTPAPTVYMAPEGLFCDLITAAVIAGSGSSGYSNGVGTLASFMQLCDNAISTNGEYALVTDVKSHTVRKVMLYTGEVTTFAGRGSPGNGNGIGTLAYFGYPGGIRISSDGTYAVTVATGSQRVRKITISTKQVDTIAGSSNGFADGIGTNAQLISPIGIAMSASDAFIIIAEFGGQRVRKLNMTSLAMTTLGGDGSAGNVNGVGTNARFRSPIFVTLSSSNDVVYVSENLGHRIRKLILSTLMITVIAGSTIGMSGSNDGLGTVAEFYKPAGLAITSDDILYVSDSANLKLRRIDLSTQLVSTITFRGGSPILNGTLGLSWLRGETGLLAVNHLDNNILKLYGTCSSPTALPSLSYSPTSSQPSSHPTIYISPEGLIECDSVVSTVLAGAGSPGDSDGYALSASFDDPYGSATAPLGEYVLVADSGNHRIRKVIVSTALVSTFVGDGTPAVLNGIGQAARVNRPKDIDISSNGLFALSVDYDGQRIRYIVLTTATVTTLAGTALTGTSNGIGTNADLNYPSGIALSSDMTFAVFVEAGSFKLRKVVVASAFVSTVAGGASSTGTVDGIGSAVHFQEPHGVALSSDDNYAIVAELYGHRIRKVTLATAVVITLAGGGTGGSVNGIGTAATFNMPRAVVMTTDDSYAFVVCQATNELRRIEISTRRVTTVVGANLSVPCGITWLHGDSKLMISNVGRDDLTRVYGSCAAPTISPSLPILDKGIIDCAKVAFDVVVGSSTGLNDGVGTNAKFDTVECIAMSRSGQFSLVVDSNSNTIRKVDIATRDVSTFVGNVTSGTVDGTGTLAQLSYPVGVDISFDGSFALSSCFMENRVRHIVISTAQVTTLGGSTAGQGNGIGTAASLQFPGGVSISSDMTFAIVGQYNGDAVRKVIISTKQWTTLAGKSSSTAGANGVGTNANFKGPMFVRLSQDNSFVIVNENSGNRVRKIVVSTAVVTRIAGSGSQGSNDGTGTLASFRQLMDVIITSDNRYALLSDYFYSKIRRVDLVSQKVTTLAFIDASLGGFSPKGLAWFYPFQDDMFIVGSEAGHSVLSVYGECSAPTSAPSSSSPTVYTAPNGLFCGEITSTVIFGSGSYDYNNGIGTNADFAEPVGIGISPDGAYALIGDVGNGAIRKLVFNGNRVSTCVGGSKSAADGIGTRAGFDFPTDIKFLSSGEKAFIVCRENNTVRQLVLSTLSVTTVSKGINGPNGMALSFDESYALVTERYRHGVSKLVLSTWEVSVVAGNGNPDGNDGFGTNAKFYHPYFVVFASTNTFALVSEASGNRIRKILISNYQVTTLAGSPTGASGTTDGLGTLAKFNGACGIVLTSDDSLLYVADISNTKVRRVVVSTQEVSTLSMQSGSPSFTNPVSLAWLPGSEDQALVMVSNSLNRIHQVYGTCAEPTLIPTLLPTKPTSLPTGQPTSQPTDQPTGQPTTSRPSGQPTGQPTGLPTVKPSGEPTSQPTGQPTGQPTSLPTSSKPTGQPTGQPTAQPSGEPTGQPSGQPTGQPSAQPTGQPSEVPSTSKPTGQPSSQPSGQPTSQPTGQPTGQPTSLPTSSKPTGQPTGQPTAQPSGEPTGQPSGQPTRQPSSLPSSSLPSSGPTGQPSGSPSGPPTGLPTGEPTGQPSCAPSTSRPTKQPSSQPTGLPTDAPTGQPSGEPTFEPTGQPSGQPTSQPTTSCPTGKPTGEPTNVPTGRPSSVPSTSKPTCQPSGQPTGLPTGLPTAQPSSIPSTSEPTGQPTGQPSGQPSGQPTVQPTVEPTGVPTSMPSGQPSGQPVSEPTSLPSVAPSSIPTSSKPTFNPSSSLPTGCPTNKPTGVPSSFPSFYISPDGLFCEHLNQTIISSDLLGPQGVVIAPSEDFMLVMEWAGCRMRKVKFASGIVTTVAGDGTVGIADGMGTLARFNRPHGVDLSTDGTFAVSICAGGRRVRYTVLSTAVVTTISGNAGAASHVDGIGTIATFTYPISVAISSTDTWALVSDKFYVRKIVLATLQVTTLAGNGAATNVDGVGTQATFSDLRFIALSSDDSFVILADWKHVIRKLVLSTTMVTSVAGNGVPGANDGVGRFASFNKPDGVALSTDESFVYVCDRDNIQIRRIELSTNITSTLSVYSPSIAFANVVGLAWLPSKQALVTTEGNNVRMVYGVCVGPPTFEPSKIPSGQPTGLPSSEPTRHPSYIPTSLPSGNPSGMPTTSIPTGEPSCQPTREPSGKPTAGPTCLPSSLPTGVPSGEPTAGPTWLPSGAPSFWPSSSPSGVPTNSPSSSAPSQQPTSVPSGWPSSEPSATPTSTPNSTPKPSGEPTSVPTDVPSGCPSTLPSSSPSGRPSSLPSSVPSFLPTVWVINATRPPSVAPTSNPSPAPTSKPTTTPSVHPSISAFFSMLKAYGGPKSEFTRSMALSSDWGSVLAGYEIGASAAEYDGFVVKTNACGDIVWSNNYGGALIDSIRKVIVRKDGSILFFGEWTSDSGSDMLIAHLNTATGTIIRSASFSRFGSSHIGYDMIEISDNSIVLVGSAITSSGTSAIVIMSDTSGNVDWVKSIGGALSAVSYYYLAGVQLNSGDVVLVGYCDVVGTKVGLITRFNSAGDVLFSRQFGSRGFDIAYSLAKCRDGGYVVAASSTSYSSSESILVMRFSSHDVFLSGFNIDGGNTDSPLKIITTHDDGYLVVGITTSIGPGSEKGFIVKLNRLGHIQWARSYGKLTLAKDNIVDVMELPGGGYRIAGHGKSYRASGSSDVFMAQISSDGDLRGHPSLMNITSVFTVVSVNVPCTNHAQHLEYTTVTSKDVTSVVSVTSVARAHQTFTSSTCTPDGFLYSQWPTETPTVTPSTSVPSSEPTATLVTSTPSESPHSSCPTGLPSGVPTTQSPTSSMPSLAPTSPTAKPTPSPSYTPGSPTPEPTYRPSPLPTTSPTFKPSCKPTLSPTRRPSAMPTLKPSIEPSRAPTVAPTPIPSKLPSVRPTKVPTPHPTANPTPGPTVNIPTSKPTLSPSIMPAYTTFPSETPTTQAANGKARNTETQGIVLDRSFGIIIAFTVVLCAFAALRIYSEDSDFSLVACCVDSFPRFSLRIPRFSLRKKQPANEMQSLYLDPETGQLRLVSFAVVPGGGRSGDAVERGFTQPTEMTGKNHISLLHTAQASRNQIADANVDMSGASQGGNDGFVDVVGVDAVPTARRDAVFYSTAAVSQASGTVEPSHRRKMIERQNRSPSPLSSEEAQEEEVMRDMLADFLVSDSAHDSDSGEDSNRLKGIDTSASSPKDLKSADALWDDSSGSSGSIILRAVHAPDAVISVSRSVADIQWDSSASSCDGKDQKALSRFFDKDGVFDSDESEESGDIKSPALLMPSANSDSIWEDSSSSSDNKRSEVIMRWEVSSDSQQSTSDSDRQSDTKKKRAMSHMRAGRFESFEKSSDENSSC